MELITEKTFANGRVMCLALDDRYPIEVTDTFLPTYTKFAVGKAQNKLSDQDLGSRLQRWMIGVSTMSGCPVGCKFCATGALRGWRRLTGREIADQVAYVVQQYNINTTDCAEFKINYTRMGEPFMNVENVYAAIQFINDLNPDTHHYISTIGLKGSDFSWITGNITLQLSVHALTDERRKELIPVNNLMTLEELGQIRTGSNLKTTINLTLVDEDDFDIEVLKKYFDPKYFFIKLSPINPNEMSEFNECGAGVIEAKNLM
jgi:23S rRNA (adenine2503-C2)-methyltransferase